MLKYKVFPVVIFIASFFSQQDLAGSDREDGGNVTTRKILRKKYVVSMKTSSIIGWTLDLTWLDLTWLDLTWLDLTVQGIR